METMENRGQKRSELDDELPADKRACSSLDRPTSSNSSPLTYGNSTTSTLEENNTKRSCSSSSPRTNVNSNNTHDGNAHDGYTHDGDMETSSSSASASNRSEREYPYNSGDDDDDGGGTSASADQRNTRRNLREVQRRRSYGDQGKIERVIISLRDDNDISGQLAGLSELCEILSFATEESVSSMLADQLSPSLVKLSQFDSNPDIMLLAMRAMTYLCDIYPPSSAFLVRHDAVPALCQKLMFIEYMDVAEQCLLALEKISREQPLACLESGAMMAVLCFIDFFSTGVQRTALKTVSNICKKLPSENPAPFMEAVPKLSNILLYEDQQLVEISASCLIKVVDRIQYSPDMLSELCTHGVVHQAANVIDLHGRTTLSQQICSGLIGMLAKLAFGCADAVGMLFELNIGRITRDLLSSIDHLHGSPSPRSADKSCNQVQAILSLLIELLPPIAGDREDKLVANKDKILVEQPNVLHSFGVDVLPVLIQVVNGGANSYVIYGCLSVIKKLVYFCKSDVLLELVKNSNMPSFLIGMFTRKDHHILTLALEITETILEKLSDVLLASFVKEGLLFAVDALITPEKCSQLMFPAVGDIHQLADGGGATKCLCYAYVAAQASSTSETRSCRLGKDYILDLAKRVKTDYFSAEVYSSKDGVTRTLQNLRNLAAELNDILNRSMSNTINSHHDESFFRTLHEIMVLVIGNEVISTFEFIESGIIKALVNYLLDGLYLREKIDAIDVLHHLNVIQKRFSVLAKVSFSSVHPFPSDSPLSLLIRKLQSALSALENFPVVVSSLTKLRGSYATVPNERSTAYPCIRARFVKGEEDSGLCEFPEDVVTIDPFCSIESIQQYLWPKVREKEAKCVTFADQAESQVKTKVDESDVHQKTIDGEGSSSAAQLGSAEELHLPVDADTSMKDQRMENATCSNVSNTNGNASRSQSEASYSTSDHRLPFTICLEGSPLDCSSSLFQELVEQQMKSHDGLCDGAKLWTETYTFTYRRASNTDNGSVQGRYCWFMGSTPDEARLSHQCLPFMWDIFVPRLVSHLEKASPVHDILFLLKILDVVNRFMCHFVSLDTVDSFVEGKIDQLDCLKLTAPTLPQKQFENAKLTEKFDQQMRDTLAISAEALPSWCNQLMSTCPFLFMFESRCKYFQLTAFGRTDRKLAARNSPRKKYLVNRDLILDSAARILDLHARDKVALEVEYFEEVGTGLGPTLEFYTLVGQEFQKADLGMWRVESLSSISGVDFRIVTSCLGLFPRPWSPTLSSSNGIEFSDVLKKFVLLGQIIARAIHDGRVIDIPFSKAFYKLILGKELSLYDIESVDTELGITLLEFKAIVGRHNLGRSTREGNVACQSDSRVGNTKIEDLCLDFTLPGYPDYLLSSRLDDVTIDNLEEYIHLVEDATLRTGISRQVEAFKYGFNQVFPIKHLQTFTEEELERLLCGEADSWLSNEMLDHIEFNHGYTVNSPPVANLMEIVQEFDYHQRRAFLQFVTGAPRLPPGGLPALNPKLTIVRKQCSNNADLDLPSVMTCVNYLKLPSYSTKEIMKDKMLYAITEGQGSFHLS